MVRDTGDLLVYAQSTGTSSKRTDVSGRDTQLNLASPIRDYHESYAFAMEPKLVYDAESRDIELEMERLKDLWDSSTFVCGVCFERFQNDHIARVMPCGHSYCRPCLRSYAISKIEARCFPISCPDCLMDSNGRSERGG